MENVNELIDRYIAIWNEPDADRRRATIAALWAEDGAHFVPSLEARGYDAIAARVTRAYERWVVTGGFTFRSANNAETHHNGVRFNWEMVPAGGGAVDSSGFEFFLLDDNGRIRADYQFIDKPPSA